MTDLKSSAALVVGVLALGAFGAATVYLAGHVASNDLEWGRLLYLFGGLEAVAFGAAGYLFGKEVNRERAEIAERKAETAEAKATNSDGAKRVAEERLANLVTVIDVKRERRSASGSVLDETTGTEGQGPIGMPFGGRAIFAGGSQRKADPDWDEVAAIANEFASRAS